MSELTTREKLAMRILRIMFIIAAPAKHDHVNRKLMDSIFEEGKTDEC
jgi:hypothetical protein